MDDLETKISQLKDTINAHSGTNVADVDFVRETEELISAFYDDIGEIKNIALKSLFDLFLIKAIYINRSSTDPHVIDYISNMMAGFLFTRDLYPMVQDGHRYSYFIVDLLEEIEKTARFQNLFEGYRKLGDHSLFISGVFPASMSRWRRQRRWLRAGDVPRVDVSYHITRGKMFYQLASDHELAEATQQRPILAKLSRYFEIYTGALNEVSDKYILGFDMNLIADKMLDNFNRHRATGNPIYLENARKYAAILKVERPSFPSVFRMRRRYRPTIL